MFLPIKPLITISKPIGNPLTYDGWTYTWEAGRQLATMSKAGQNLSFKYNDSGIRTQKTVNGVTTKYTLNGDKVTLEDNGTDKIYYSYDAAGNLVSMNLNDTEYYYIRNVERDIIALINDAGTQVVGYTYDSWGKLITTTGSLASTVGVKNPYLYRGYRSDSETGLYYLQSRYYSPEWGRFINADAEGGKVGKLLSHNVFVYCLYNPVNMSDESGFRPDFDSEEDASVYYLWLRQQRSASSSESIVTQNAQPNNGIVYSKTQHSQGDSGLRDLSTEEISKRAKDRSLSPQERKRYVTEEKYRGVRNVDKRKEKNKSKIVLYPETPSLVDYAGNATGLTGTALVIYLIISEGSRIFPPRNLIPLL